MLDLYRQLTTQQFHAALSTVNGCIDRCPDDVWEGPLVLLKFNQAVFHTLFYADVYLGRNLEELRKQPYHRQHAEFFADYEELEDRAPQRVYEKPALKDYARYCRDKAAAVLDSETEETLHGPSGFPHLQFSRAELHVYALRHIQHHAAQLIMRLRLDTDANPPWYRSGWCEQ